MEIERYDPWEEFDRIQKQISRLIEEFFADFPHPGRTVAFAPAVDVYESEYHIVVRAALPGVVEDDVDITATELSVTIRGERDTPGDAVRGGYFRREWAYGFFERQVSLPRRVEPEKLHARYFDGVFEIRLPIAE